MRHLLILSLIWCYTLGWSSEPNAAIAQTLPETTTRPGDDQILLNFPENLELKLFVDYVSDRLGVNIYYDDQVINQRITIKAPISVQRQSLLSLLEGVLQTKGLLLVDTSQAGWKRIVPATGLIGAARPSTEPSLAGPASRPSAAVTQVFSLQYADPAKIDPLIRPFLTQPGGSSIAYSDQRLLIVTDYASNVQRISTLVALVDRAPRQISTQFLQLRYVDAQQLVTQVTQVLSAQRKLEGVGGGAASGLGVELVAEPRTNQLVVVGADDDVREAIALAKSLDVSLELRTVTYNFAYISPERVDRLVRELIGPADVKRVYQSAIDREANLLIATATEEAHRRIQSLKQSLDVGGAQEQENPVKFYSLSNTTAAEVLQTISSIEGEEDLGKVIVERPSNSQSEHSGGQMSEGGSAGAQLPGIAPYSSGAGGKPELAAAKESTPAIRSIKTKEATVTADANTNTIIVVARPAVQQVYEELIRRLDKRRPQVLIECTIVTLNTSNDFSLGVEISSRGGSGNKEVINFSSFGLSTVGTGTNLGQLTLTPGVGFNGTIISSDVADIVVRALAHSGRAEVMSAPRILVNDNTTGTLASVDEAPFTSVNASSTVATTAFAGYATAGTTVTLTPHISESEHLQLEYSISLNNFTGGGSQGIPPPRQSNTINSRVTIPDGSTIIVGGLNRKDYSNTVDAVPLLGQIPILQYLFSNRTISDHTSTLFVFVRPVVLRDDQFQDLKFYSSRDAKRAELPSDYPPSEPLTMR